MTPILPCGSWKTTGRGPHVTTSGFAVDRRGYFPLLHRSDKVRSAKTCWSLPSGLHENGYTLRGQFAVELQEELNLSVVPHSQHVELGCYENIAAHEDWHWVIHVLMVQVEDAQALVNQEPDKHDVVQLVHCRDFLHRLADFTPWSPGLGSWLSRPDFAIQYRQALAQLGLD